MRSFLRKVHFARIQGVEFARIQGGEIVKQIRLLLTEMCPFVGKLKSPIICQSKNQNHPLI